MTRTRRAPELIVESFTYRPIGWAAGLNPWIKLAFAAEAMALTFAMSSWFQEALLAGALVALAASSGLLRRMAGALSMGVAFSAVIFALDEYAAGPSALALGATLGSSALSALEFLNFMGYASFVFTATSPEEIEHVLRRLGLPSEIAFVITAATRFVPVVLRDALGIYYAQRARGLRLSRNPAKLLRGLMPLLVPLVVISLRRSEGLAEAMEVRGYMRPRGARGIREYGIGRRDVAFMAAASALGALLLAAHSILFV